MTKQIIISFILWLACVNLAISQNTRIDSLRNVLKSARPLEERVGVLNQICNELWDYDFEAAKEYAEEELRLARRAKYTEGQVMAFTDLGMYYYFKGDYTTAREYYHDAISICGDNNFGRYPSYTFTRIGNLFRMLGKFDSAKYNYDKARALLRGRSFPVSESSALYNTGLIFLDVSGFDSAEYYLNNALKLRQQINDSLLMAECWRNLGIISKMRGDYQVAAGYYDRVRQVAVHYDNPEHRMFYFIYQGELLFLKGNYQEAIKMFSDALDLLKTHEFRRFYGVTLQQIGRVFDAEGAYNAAIEHFFKALDVFEEVGDQHEIARCQIQIGWIYVRMRNFKLCLEFGEKGLQKMKELNDPHGIAFALNLKGYVSHLQKDYDKALSFFNEAITIRRNLGLKVETVNTLFNMARTYEELGEYDEALEVQRQVLNADVEYGNKPEEARDRNGMASLYLKVGNFKLAEAELRKARSIENFSELRPQQQENIRLWGELFNATGKYQLATANFKKLLQFRDSLDVVVSADRSVKLNALYQLDEKDKEIKLLHQQKQLQQNEIELQRSQLRQQAAYIIAAVVGFVLVLTIAILTHSYNRRIRRANKAILDQKNEIEAQAEELLAANESLSKLNREIFEQKEEIQAQSEELVEANEAISRTNSTLEESVETRTRELRQAYQELDTFFYRSSHDFRRPITTFLGLAEVAKITINDPYALELFDKVKATATHLDRMLFKLQSVSNLGGQQMIFTEVALKELIEETVNSHKDALAEKKIKVTTDYGLTNEMYGYPALVRIVIENLFENAIEFAGVDDPYIKLEVRNEGELAMVAVEDNGQGIDQEYHLKIFDMYVRANERSKGSGLGLYIVKKAVERLGGRIQFTSQKNKGSRFTVYLPLHHNGSPIPTK